MHLSSEVSNTTNKTLHNPKYYYRFDTILAGIFVIITALYIMLIFQDYVPSLGLIILGVLWLIYWAVSGRLSVASPLDFSLLLFLCLLPLNLAISVDWGLSLPKVYGLILSVALFFTIVNIIRNFSYLFWSIIALVILALSVVFSGWISLEYSNSGIEILNQIFNQFAKFKNFFSDLLNNEQINPNTIGGALTFFPPLLLSLIWDGGAFKRTFLQQKKAANGLFIVYKFILVLVFLLVSITLFFTMSTAAILGAFLGILALMIWKNHHYTWLIPVLVIAAGGYLYYVSNGNFEEYFTLLLTAEHDSILSRVDAWQSVITMIQDFPLTGTGIGTYSQLYDKFYITHLSSSWGYTQLHAHNTFLSIAIDIGLPGLVLYTSLLSSCFFMVIKTLRRVRSITKFLLMGLSCGLLAHQIFGIVDAFLLGTKLGFIQWIFIGLIAGIFTHKKAFRNENHPQQLKKPDWKQTKRWLKSFLISLGWWMLFSLASLAPINYAPLASVMIAVLGGIIMGYILTSRFNKRGALKEI